MSWEDEVRLHRNCCHDEDGRGSMLAPPECCHDHPKEDDFSEVDGDDGE